VESAQRVFYFHSTSPLHWIDLSTIIEAVILHEKIALPVLHDNYAEPLVRPLMDADVLDPWWPEAGLYNGPMLGTKEEIWTKQPDKNKVTADAHAAIRMMCGGWPDDHFEGLSEARKKAINGIAHGFAPAALMGPEMTDDVSTILLWGTKTRETAGSMQTQFLSRAL
jgi:hypothetical protein